MRPPLTLSQQQSPAIDILSIHAWTFGGGGRRSRHGLRYGDGTRGQRLTHALDDLTSHMDIDQAAFLERRKPPGSPAVIPIPISMIRIRYIMEYFIL
jgi:hypothetical protein